MSQSLRESRLTVSHTFEMHTLDGYTANGSLALNESDGSLTLNESDEGRENSLSLNGDRGGENSDMVEEMLYDQLAEVPCYFPCMSVVNVLVDRVFFIDFYIRKSTIS